MAAFHSCSLRFCSPEDNEFTGRVGPAGIEVLAANPRET